MEIGGSVYNAYASEATILTTQNSLPLELNSHSLLYGGCGYRLVRICITSLTA